MIFMEMLTDYLVLNISRISQVQMILRNVRNTKLHSQCVFVRRIMFYKMVNASKKRTVAVISAVVLLYLRDMNNLIKIAKRNILVKMVNGAI